MRVLVKFVSLAAVVAGLTGCVSYGNTHALITPVGVAGYHTFKPSQPARDIHLQEQRDPNRIAAVHSDQERANQEQAEQEQSADGES